MALAPINKKKPTDAYLERMQKNAATVKAQAAPVETVKPAPKPTSSVLSSTTEKSKQPIVQNATTISQPKSTALGTTAPTPMLSIPTYQPLTGRGDNQSTYSMRRLNEINRMGEIETETAFQTAQRIQAAREAALAGMGGLANPFDKYTDPGTAATDYGGLVAGLGTGKVDLTKLGLSKEQAANADAIIKIGQKRGIDAYGIETALMTALAESNLINVNYGDRDSLGLFQQRPSQGWGTPQQVSDVTYATNKFFDALQNTKRGQNMWNTAQNVQRSAFADGSNYKAKAPLAAQIMQAYRNAPGTSENKANIMGWVNSNVGKYHDFDGYYGAQCVDLFRYYHRDIVGSKQIGSVGAAKNIWSSKEMDKSYNRISKGGKAQQGDVVVMDGSWGSGYGHVAIVIQDKGGMLTMINSNSTTVGNGKPTNIVTVPKKGILGYFRPKKFA